MANEGYLAWVIQNTPTCWWHDSADPRELEWALEHGAIGVTTNPYLANLSLANNKFLWSVDILLAMGSSTPEAKAEALMRLPVTHVARRLQPMHERTSGRHGWVCAQVNPLWAGDREKMLAMARRLHGWGPNITVKLPATSAGLDVLESCVAEGISATATVSFTVAQVLAMAAAHRRGAERARSQGITPGRGFAVLMVGRLDDYLREVAADTRAAVREADIRLAGIAVARRALSMLHQVNPEVELIIAAFRGLHHMTELAGGEYIMSISPGFQGPLAGPELACEPGLGRPLPEDALARLRTMPEFVRAYEPDGMKPEEFISYGLAQRTLAQFAEAGWKLMENFPGD